MSNEGTLYNILMLTGDPSLYEANLQYSKVYRRIGDPAGHADLDDQARVPGCAPWGCDVVLRETAARLKYDRAITCTGSVGAIFGGQVIKPRTKL